MAIKPRSVPTKTLAQNLSSSGTTLYISDTLDWDGVQLSSADFGSQAFAVLRNAANTQIEFIEIDETTITSSNAITILKRGLGYDGTQTADTETKYNWNAFDTYVELGADTPQLLAQLVEEAGDETIAGVKTFSSSPIAPTPTTATQVAIKSYVDGVAIAGVADSDDTTKGAVEQATMAEIEAGSASGGTTAPIVVKASRLGARLYTAYAADAGSNDTYAITCAPAPTAYTAGMVVTFKANTINTGACTINVNALGARDIRKNNGLVLSDGDIAAGGIYTMIYNGTYFELQSPIGKAQLSQSGSEVYAADSVGTDSYAISLSPGPLAYVGGLVVRFLAGTLNTGACTLSVNGGTAAAIKKNYNADLVTGDILAGQIVEVIYDSVNSVWQMISPVARVTTYTTGSTTYTISTASGTQTIAHGLGLTPKMVRLTANLGGANGSPLQSFGTYNGTTNACTYVADNGTQVAGSSSSVGIVLRTSAGNDASGVITFDATNITITWTKTGTPTGTAEIMWEATV